MADYQGEIDPSDLGPGDYELTVIATDTEGNVKTTAPIAFSVPFPPPSGGPTWDGPQTWDGPNYWDGSTIFYETPLPRPRVRVEIAFGQAPFTVDPEWTDVTDDVLLSSGITVIRGSTADNPQPTPGTVSYTLRDLDRRYDPENSLSPYSGMLTANCPTRVQAVFGASSTRIVSSWSLHGASPINGIAEETVPIGYGYIEGFPQTYSDPADVVTTIDINAPDALAILARTSFMPAEPFTCADDEPPEGTPVFSSDEIVSSNPIVPGATYPDWMLTDESVVADPIPLNPAERSGDRILILSQLAGIPDDFLIYDNGQSIIEAGYPQEQTLLDHFRKIVATEYGRFYQRADGALRFVERQSGNVSQPIAIFSDTLGIPYASLQLDYADKRFLVNRCVRKSRSVAEVIAQDNTSRDRNGLYEDSQELAFDDPQDAVDQANYIVGRFKDAQARITGMTIKPDRNPGLMFPTTLRAECGDVYAVSRWPLRQGYPIVKYVTAEQISHRIDPFYWETSFDFGESDTTTYFTVDDTTFGVVDAHNLVSY